MSALVPSLLAALIGGGFALLGIWVKGVRDSAEEHTRSAIITFTEFEDIARHYDRNVFRMKVMSYKLRQESKWPEPVHIEKLKWPEDTYIFTSDAVKYSSTTTVSNIYKMRLRLRNANLDVSALMRAFKNGEDDFLAALSFVEKRHLRIKTLSLELTGRSKRTVPHSVDDETAAYKAVDDMLFVDRPLSI